jgi:hypothetical protein
MVSPEQCETAPKTLMKAATQPVAPAASSARLVLLAALALAASSGAMFGVVVFGNEFTKDVHPKGASHMDSVTLVDMNDNAIATADVQTYASLLDLPLLGTAELNKVDGITFSTHEGIQHRKVTGYTITKEVSETTVGTVESPRLSLQTADSAVTMEISVREAKAWLDVQAGSIHKTTPVHVSSTRRLGSGGACLENGACLYSREELLTLDSASRKLAEGSFFARADIAAYQVSLGSEDILNQIPSTDVTEYVSGTKTIDGHTLALKYVHGPRSVLSIYNETSRRTKILSKNASFVLLDGRIMACQTANAEINSVLQQSGIEAASIMDRSSIEASSDSSLEDFIPASHLTREDCVNFNTKIGNLSSGFSQTYWTHSFDDLRPGNAQRKMKEAMFPEKSWAQRNLEAKEEMLAYMQDPNNDVNQRHEAARSGGRRLDEYWVKSSDTFAPDSYITHFQLWLATRLADPTFKTIANFYYDSKNPDGTNNTYYNDKGDWFSEGTYVPPSIAWDMAGAHGVGPDFLTWSNFMTFQESWIPDEQFNDIDAIESMGESESMGDDGMFNLEVDISSSFWHMLFPGSCSGGYGDGGGYKVNVGVLYGACINAGDTWMEFAAMRRLDTLIEEKFADVSHLPEDEQRQQMHALDRLKKHSNHFDEEVVAERRRLAKSQLATDFTECYLDCWCNAIEMFTDIGNADVKSISCPACDSKISGSKYGGSLELHQGNAWASMLVISQNNMIETVAAFQGTKADDPTMIQYNIDTKPMFVWVGGNPVLITEGHLRYVGSLIDCMYDLSDAAWMYFGREPTFITGHSLGGAAATLFAKANPCWMDPDDSGCSGGWRSLSGYTDYSTYPRLVTFGAPPTSYRGAYHPDITCGGRALGKDDATLFAASYAKIDCPAGRSMDAQTFDEYVDLRGGSLSYPCDSVSPEGVRFFHKFDPIPSIMMWLGQYEHEVANSFMVWDVATSNCAPTDGCTVMAAGDQAALIPRNGMDVDANEIPWHLCDSFSVKAQSMSFPCWAQFTSYMSLLNPLPCGQAIVQNFIESFDNEDLEPYDATINSAYINAANLQYSMFREFENFDYCVESWIGSVQAYLASGAVAEPKYMGLFFTFTWLHSTYGFYPLCVLNADGTMKSIVEDMGDAFSGSAISFDCDQEPTCLAFCTASVRKLTEAGEDAKIEADEEEFVKQGISRELQAGLYGSYDCFGECMDTLCGSYTFSSSSV